MSKFIRAKLTMEFSMQQMLCIETTRCISCAFNFAYNLYDFHYNLIKDAGLSCKEGTTRHCINIDRTYTV